MIVKLVARLLGRRELWLRDHQGEVYHTFEAAWNPFGRWCFVYPLTRIGQVVLLDGGKTMGAACYIEEWFGVRP